ncbi:MAG: MFS transporter [Xanthomonadales bacterium]|jgi:nitrate/nitrite transporter NarK|nr:MFS transporter [Xanthomonadales bacterium]
MQRILHILVLILAGEMIFSLPFHTARFFRPTLLEAFGFSNTQLGDAFAVYGVMAMLAYFPGGALADRYPARKLMSLSLFATAVGGLYMATFPGVVEMSLLYGYWGVTTILLFWGALIRATRDWGGHRSQGVAFGILDGGRGLVAAGVAMTAVTVLTLYLPLDGLLDADIERRQGLRAVILLYTAATAACGVLAWFLVPDSVDAEVKARSRLLDSMLLVLRRPMVWAQAAVIICAYCAFKGLDNYSLYAVQVLGLDEIEAARLTAWASYLRPLAAVLTGVAADRFSAGRAIAVAFGGLVVCYALLAIAVPSPAWLPIIYANFFASFFAAFALRGVYFALLEETRTPRHLTGATVGAVSFIGFTPEIFFAPIAGRILDQAPGLAGHQHYFMFLGGIALGGVVVIAWLLRLQRKGAHLQPPAR